MESFGLLYRGWEASPTKRFETFVDKRWFVVSRLGSLSYKTFRDIFGWFVVSRLGSLLQNRDILVSFGGIEAGKPLLQNVSRHLWIRDGLLYRGWEASPTKRFETFVDKRWFVVSRLGSLSYKTFRVKNGINNFQTGCYLCYNRYVSAAL